MTCISNIQLKETGNPKSYPFIQHIHTLQYTFVFTYCARHIIAVGNMVEFHTVIQFKVQIYFSRLLSLQNVQYSQWKRKDCW